ncbi:hypothetical protein ScPMuIL_012600 [Solemya velum]
MNCKNGRCSCGEKEFWDTMTSVCTQKKHHNRSCKNSNECDLNLLCLNKLCDCPRGEKWDTAKPACVKVSCSSPGNCTQDRGLVCIDGFCDCNSDEFWHTSSIPSCQPKRLNGTSCSSSDQCHGEKGLGCTNGLCNCESKKFWDTDIHVCQPKKSYGGKCAASEACRDDLGLQCTNGTCACHSLEVWDAYTYTCQPEVISCTISADECGSNGLSCIEDVCACHDTEYWDTSDPTSLCKPNCTALYVDGVRDDGIYSVNPDITTGGAFEVYCDMTAGGWTTIQRRSSRAVKFYEPWVSYANGFGRLTDDHWLGLNNIHRLTSAPSEIQITVSDYDGNVWYIAFQNFTVSDESDNFRLQFSPQSKDSNFTYEDEFIYHNNLPFSTYDRDNDRMASSCAKSRGGGWWYLNCYRFNLNGKYGTKAIDGIASWNVENGYTFYKTLS